jgi:trigger factor
MLWWRQRLDEGAGKELAMRPAQRHTFAILESEAREPTVKVTLERLPESRVQLQIEIDEDRLERSLDSAYKRIAQKNRFPGFRPGKAPRAIVERAVGRSGLIREALDKLVPDAYNEAIETEDVDAIGQPELEIDQLEPVKFTAIVPVRPKVTLNDYREIRVEREAVDVTPEMVDEQIELLRRRHATHAPVERAVQWGDILIADVKGEAEGDQFLEDENAEFPLREGQVLFLEGLAEAFVGMAKDETKEITLSMPEDFRIERLQGKDATFTLRIREVKEERLPELDDEFAGMVNDEFEDMDALRKRIEDDIRSSLENNADQKVRNEAVDKLTEVATLEYPKLLVEHEITHLVNEATGNDQAQYQMYLRQFGRSEEEFRETWREAAEMRVKRSLVLSELAEAEGLEIAAEEIDQELDSLVAPMGDDAERFRQMFASEEGVATIRRNLLSRKTLDRLAAIAKGELTEEPV